MTSSHHVYEVRSRKDHRGVDLISDVLPFGRLWYTEVADVSALTSVATTIYFLRLIGLETSKPVFGLIL